MLKKLLRTRVMTYPSLYNWAQCIVSASCLINTCWIDEHCLISFMITSLTEAQILTVDLPICLSSPISWTQNTVISSFVTFLKFIPSYSNFQSDLTQFTGTEWSGLPSYSFVVFYHTPWQILFTHTKQVIGVQEFFLLRTLVTIFLCNWYGITSLSWAIRLLKNI